MQYLNICQYCFTAHKEDLSHGNSTGIMKRNCAIYLQSVLQIPEPKFLSFKVKESAIEY